MAGTQVLPGPNFSSVGARDPAPMTDAERGPTVLKPKEKTAQQSSDNTHPPGSLPLPTTPEQPQPTAAAVTALAQTALSGPPVTPPTNLKRSNPTPRGSGGSGEANLKGSNPALGGGHRGGHLLHLLK